MTWRTVATLVLYAIALGSFAIYSPSDLPAYLAVAVAAHIGLGVGVARVWALAVPVAAVTVYCLAPGSTWLGIFIFAPPLVILTALGWALGHSPSPVQWAAATACVAGVALPAAVWAADHRHREPHVSASLQRQLPTEVSLGNLCPGAESPPALERDVTARAETLLRALRDRPDHYVTYTFYYADGGGVDRRDITIRELAEEQLGDLEGPGCELDLEHRLRAAL